MGAGLADRGRARAERHRLGDARGSRRRAAAAADRRVPRTAVRQQVHNGARFDGRRAVAGRHAGRGTGAVGGVVSSEPLVVARRCRRAVRSAGRALVTRSVRCGLWRCYTEVFRERCVSHDRARHDCMFTLHSRGGRVVCL